MISNTPTIHLSPAGAEGPCACCGRAMTTGDLQTQVHGTAVHADCAATALAPREVPGPAITSSKHGQVTSVELSMVDEAGTQACDLQTSVGGDGRPGCYTHNLQLLDPSPVTAGGCTFEVRIPGWITDVTARNLADAAWAAQEVVREHTSYETVEVRCAQRRECDHPAQWNPIWQYM